MTTPFRYEAQVPQPITLFAPTKAKDNGVVGQFEIDRCLFDADGLEVLLVADSLCRGQEKRTTHKPEG